ncbi:MAG: protease modulator HflC [Pseudomonadota bacterium]
MGRSVFGGVLILIAVAIVTAYFTLFTVYQTQQALVLQFGQTKRIISEPGLHWKIPFIQNVVMLDKRILALDSPAQEVIASDQKRLVVDAFARYRINDPLRFFQSVGTIGVANSRLATILNSSVRRVLGEASFEAVVRDDRPELMQQILGQLGVEAATFGIQVVDVRIRRADLPEANSQAIYSRMQTARQQEAAEIRAEGEEAARRIRSRADRDVTVLVAQANQESEQIRGQGDAQRANIFAQAFNQDPDFFQFYRSMQAYAAGLASDDTRLVLSPNSDFFRFFRDPTGAGPAGGAAPSPAPGQ